MTFAREPGGDLSSVNFQFVEVPEVSPICETPRFQVPAHILSLAESIAAGRLRSNLFPRACL
jgi:hypothetical protein